VSYRILKKTALFLLRIMKLCISEVVWTLDMLTASKMDVMQIFG